MNNLILAIDTSTKSASVALAGASSNKILAEFFINTGLTHSETLLPMIEQLFLGSRADKRQLQYIAISEGPGSFTGLRIGAAFAKGLAMACKIPIIPIGTLEILAYNIRFCDSLIVPILDARRSQVYSAIFCGAERLTEDGALDFDELVELVLSKKKPAVFVGDAVEIFAEQICSHPQFSIADAQHNFPKADALAMIAAKSADRAIDAADFAPVYIRKPQAQREMEANVKNA